MNNNDSNTDTANIADTNTNTNIRKFFTPLSQTQKSTDSSNNQNKKLVKDNYPRLRLLANDIKDNIQSLFLKHNATLLEIDKVNLEHKNDMIEFNFQLANNFTTNEYLNSIIYACDDALVSRDNLR
ncbi:26333_t:CDS:2 [Dentiscutata erythropus]|uniref:26333_t:CDS:1 n=1 Tax=Dentiscutata erythropus TaxID=1348616 RepID=A0A9N9DR92_9GLOM|nr:26333_t:CDS:2 [Dentiscutata erythropus]